MAQHRGGHLENVSFATAAPAFPVVERPAGNAKALVSDSLSEANLQANTQVRVVNLKQRPELNGMTGRLHELDPRVEGRWRVVLDSGRGVSLRPENLEAICARDAMEEKQYAQPAAKPSQETLSARNPAEETHNAQSSVESSRAHSAASQDCRLHKGAQVLISGLVKRPELNGRRGHLLDFHGGEGRWGVMLEDGAGFRLKSDNLQLIGGSAEDAVASISGPPSSAVDGVASIPGNSLKEDCHNVRMQEGDRIKIKGLAARPELNDMFGNLHRFVAEEDRWNVVLDNGKGVCVRSDCLERVDSPHVPSADEQSQAPLQQHVASSGSDFKAGDRVRVVGLSGRAELNGRRGYLHVFDSAQGRWNVVLDDDPGLKGVSLRPSKLERDLGSSCTAVGSASSKPSLPPNDGQATEEDASQDALTLGDDVVLHGLQAQPELNGIRGLLVNFDEVACRWEVVLADGSSKMLRPEKLQRCSRGAAIPPLEEP